MKHLQFTFAVAALAGGIAASTAIAQNTSTVPLSSAAQTINLEWVNALPGPSRTNPAAVKITMSLIPDLAQRAGAGNEALRLYAYPIKFGGDNANYIIAYSDNFAFCGTLGCLTYIFRQSDATRNKWSLVLDENFNNLMIPSDPSRLSVPTVRAVDNPRDALMEWTYNGNKFVRRLIADPASNPAKPGGPAQ